MSVFGDDLAAIVADLQGVGLLATDDPGQVLGLVTVDGVCALVEPPAAYLNVSFGIMIEVTVPVRLITAGPYDHAAVDRLHAALEAVWPVLQPVEPVVPTLWQAGDADMPALTIPAARQLPCPLPVALSARTTT